ncbi:hypothetical protein BpHYR1_005864 [Brachionus plicatilis]|uniref:Uncharacterized protein n=1 Tax=Brachionus plicatilis TaxID=10195 RepID=A0A3M7T9Y7_BRAPC|nr:hypothetical protein BpHYR1_005864 [Brachionus plicatilis]
MALNVGRHSYDVYVVRFEVVAAHLFGLVGQIHDKDLTGGARNHQHLFLRTQVNFLYAQFWIVGIGIEGADFAKRRPIVVTRRLATLAGIERRRIRLKVIGRSERVHKAHAHVGHVPKSDRAVLVARQQQVYVGRVARLGHSVGVCGAHGPLSVREHFASLLARRAVFFERVVQFGGHFVHVVSAYDGRRVNRVQIGQFELWPVVVKAHVVILALYHTDCYFVRIVDARTPATKNDVWLVVAASFDKALGDRFARVRPVDNVGGTARTGVGEDEGAVRVRRGYALALLVERGRLDRLLGLHYLIDVIFDEVEEEPEAALVRDQQFGQLFGMVTYGLDGSELTQFFVRCGHVFEYVVFVDDAGHQLKLTHVEHVYVAGLEAKEQVAVVVEQSEGGQAHWNFLDWWVFAKGLDRDWTRPCLSCRCGKRVRSPLSADTGLGRTEFFVWEKDARPGSTRAVGDTCSARRKCGCRRFACRSLSALAFCRSPLRTAWTESLCRLFC